MDRPLLIPRVLGDNEDFPIKPEDIDLDALETANAFNVPGHVSDNETMIVYTNKKMNEGAAIVVQTCQNQGHWGPCNPFKTVYAHEETTFSLGVFLQNKHQFNGLVVRGDGRLWRVTNTFIIYCYLAAAKIRAKPRQLSPTTIQIEG